ncbi:Ost1p [Sugiyamaella lignohabitans]|uniref:Dolichyl-diphosphooligosaccharide--protein glycosyltransferase subunit 1 n=1 Tax=Sugiyamaella lignohabitans TaxID=796027 RepID=A0A161HFT0_9ASCO|nr:Ost1p [Sugiyamaella lignohabitans]ANB14470.1 Ost1p [Sugiyamaella lignohabitans]
MRLVNLLQVSVALFSVASAESIIPKTFENVQLTQSIDLTGSYLKRSLDITARNIADEPQQVYIVAVDSKAFPNLSILEGQDKSTGRSVLARRIEDAHDDGVEYYQLSLREPVQPGEELNLLVAEAYSGLLSPLPEVGGQDDEQYLVYSGSKYALSPYDTLVSSLKIKIYGTYAEELTIGDDEPEQATVEGSGHILSFGEYKELAPLSSKPFKLRYSNPRPLVRADKLERDIWVSHWGASVSIEETYWLTNIGTRLKDSFSRLDYNKGQSQYNLNVASIRQLRFPLGPNARDAYYTDLVGNVSTSHFRSNGQESILEIAPRYPVFGGWHYNFTVGWSHDLSDFVKDVGNENYLLKIPIIQGPQDISYGEVDVRVILPEGASDIQVVSLFGASTDISNTYSFLDTKGRPTVEFKYNNLIDGHRSGEFFVQYTYTTGDSLRKPLAIALTFASFFTLFLVFDKIDVSIFRKK